MNILLYFTFEYSLQSWKKSGTLDKELLFYRELSRRHGIKYTFITYGDSSDENIIDDDFFDVIPIYKYYKPSKSKLKRYIHSFLFPLKIKKMGIDFSIIKQNQLQGSWASIILSIITRKPLIVRTGYDVLTFTKFENKSKFKVYLYKLLTKISVKYSNLYTVTSSVDKQYLLSNLTNTDKIKIRPNWVVLNNLENIKTSDSLVSVGRLERQKNYSFLIDMLSNSDLISDVYGTGTLQEELIEYADKKNTKINFLGSINNNEILSILNFSKFYITTSLYEGNPKTVLEAMSRGCVVFASKIPNHEELITHLENGYLFDIKKINIIDDIKKVMNDEKLLVKLSNNAVSRVRDNNSIELLLEYEVSDYNNLIVK